MSRRTRLVVELVVLWVAATAGVLVAAWRTTIGPVLVELSPSHGIHLGDVTLALGVASACTAITVERLRRRGPGSREAAGSRRGRGGATPRG